MSVELLKNYARGIRDKVRANRATPETGLAPVFQSLIQDLLPTLPAIEPLTVSPEFNKIGVGKPDIA